MSADCGAEPRAWRWAPWAVLLLGFVFHAPGLRGGFVYDDSWTWLANPVIREPTNLLRLLGPDFARADLPDAGRPVMLASAIVDWWLWGRSPLGPHVMNLLWHLGVTGLLFRLLLPLALRATGTPALAALAAAVHAVHPLHVEVVAVINYREDLLATFFLLGAMLAIESARQRTGGRAAGLRALAFTSALLSCLSKESAYLAVVLLVLLDVCRDPAGRRRAADYLLLALPALLAFAWRWWVFAAPATVSRTAELPAERFERAASLLAGCRSLIAGLAQYLWPARLSPEYLPPATVTAGAGLALGVGAAAAVILAALLAVRATRARGPRPPLVALGFLWALVAYLPHLGLVPLTNLRADRYFYLPGLGLALLVAAAGVELHRFVGERRPALGAARALGVPLPGLLAAALVAVLGLRTVSQGRIWRNDGTVFQAAVTRAPGAPRAWRGLANAHLHAGRTLEALASVDRALALRDDAHARELRGLILMRQGALALARSELSRALGESGPGHRPRVLNNLGYVELEQGLHESALGRFAEARRLAPAFDRPYLNAARALEQRGEPARAQALLRELVHRVPGSIDGWAQLGALAERQGNLDEARQAYRRALALSGGDLALAARLAAQERR